MAPSWKCWDICTGRGIPLSKQCGRATFQFKLFRQHSTSTLRINLQTISTQKMHPVSVYCVHRNFQIRWDPDFSNCCFIPGIIFPSNPMKKIHLGNFLTISIGAERRWSAASLLLQGGAKFLAEIFSSRRSVGNKRGLENLCVLSKPLCASCLADLKYF